MSKSWALKILYANDIKTKLLNKVIKLVVTSLWVYFPLKVNRSIIIKSKLDFTLYFYLKNMKLIEIYFKMLFKTSKKDCTVHRSGSFSHFIFYSHTITILYSLIIQEENKNDHKFKNSKIQGLVVMKEH